MVRLGVFTTEWWIVQSGAISGKFENAGEFHAMEGDVLYAAPDMWHKWLQRRRMAHLCEPLSVDIRSSV
jgi:hypothetical protein